jgi:hypothetical protein
MTEANIDELNLTDDVIGEVDYDAPEPGSFPPRVKPGIYDFKFELEDDEPFGTTTWEKDGKHFFEIRHKATITVTKADGTQEDVTLRFCRANFFQNPAMKDAGINSSGGELLRSLGIVIKGSLSRSVLEQSLREADGRSHGRCSVGWRVKFDGSDVVVSTSPRKKKGEVKWPKDKDGNFLPMATDPKSGQKAYGRENILNYLLPQTAPTQEATGTAAAGADPFAQSATV